MHNVITADQARKITRGRTPHVPVEYEQACKALQACCTLDEGKYWSDKADALAAWAKIYQDKTIERQAKILKLRAYRRMGELATEIARSARVLAAKRDDPGSCPSRHQRLRDAGLAPRDAILAARLGDEVERRVNDLEKRPRVPSPATAVKILDNSSCTEAGLTSSFARLAALCRTVKVVRYRAFLATKSHSDRTRHVLEEVQEWLELVLR